MTPRPLLSIAVPTYQRAAMLRVMLQALLPQEAELRDRVEVCIGDNASTDSTADVVESERDPQPRAGGHRGCVRRLRLGHR